MGAYRHRLSFNADHDSADLGSLPEQLGMTADQLWRVGDPSIAPNGRVIGGNRRYSYCGFDLEVLEDLPQSLEAAVAKLKPHKSFLSQLSASGVMFHFFIGWFSDDLNSGERLGWELLRDIADLKIALDIDFYGQEETVP